MKNIIKFKKLEIVIMIIVTFTGKICAQQGNSLWKPIGTDTVFTNRDVKINKSLDVKEYLKVGDSALWLVPFNGVDHIRSDIGKISLMEGTNSAYSSNIQVGIGTTSTILGVSLNVLNDINVGITKGYRINGKIVLQIPGTDDIFVGQDAGVDPSYAGVGNSFLGSKTGFSNRSGYWNSFVGFHAGYSNIYGQGNSFFGKSAGYSNSDGSLNTFIGFYSGSSNTLGIKNTFIGNSAGTNNTIGDNNTCLGSYARVSGDFDNSTAIGANALVGANNSMVFGAPDGTFIDPIKVGIGTTTPQNRLEIVSNISLPSLSGLRLTSLSGYVPTTNTNTALTVDGNGDVILANVNSITWLGSLSTAPLSPTLNDAYYNTTVNISYIWNGTSWNIIAQDGINGTQGTQGIQGLPGSNGTQGIQGLPGTNGTNGVDGINGINGKTVLNGSANPTITQGVNGDFYINTTTHTIFGPKASGIWGTGTSLVGPQGIQGIAGPTGPVGTVNAYNGCSMSTTFPGYVVLGGNPLSQTTTIPLAGNNLLFTGQGKIGIGTSTPPTSKLDINNTSYEYGVNISSIFPSTIGRGLTITQSGGTAHNYSLLAITTGTGSTNIALCGVSYGIGGNTNKGVTGSASGAINNTGGHFSSSGGLQSSGGQFSASSGSYSNYGILTYATGVNSWAGWFQGNLNVQGSYYLSGVILNLSDSIVKENIENISSALSTINQLSPKTFTFKRNDFPYMNLPDGQQIGLISQEVQAIYPNLVKEMVYPAQLDSLGNVITLEQTFKTLNYNALIPITIKGIQELDSIVTTLLPLLIPDAPVLVSPVNDATGLPIKPITLTWNRSERALNYIGEIALDPYFIKVIEKFSTSDSSAIIAVHDYNTTYYWRVMAYNNTGKSGFSAVFSFSTQLIPGTPILLSPADNAANVTLTNTFLWSNGIKVAYNIIEVALDSDFKKLVAQYQVKDSTIDIKLREYNTLHFWRVTAYLFDNNSARSQTYSFTTELMPGTATLISPANGSANVPIIATFLWSNGIVVEKNIIEVALDPDFKTLVTQFSTKDSTKNLILKEYSTLHYWRVTTYPDASSSVSTVSQTFTFTTEGKAAAKMDTLTQVSYRSASDLNYKTNIGTITNPLQKILQLNGISYDWRVNDFPNINFDNNRQLGFIAQEVESIIPEVVRKDNNGFYSMDYDRLTPVLAEAIKELNAKNTMLTTVADSLKNVIASYETRFANIETLLATCCQNQEGKLMQGNSSGNNKDYDNTEISSVIHITPDNSINSSVTELYQNRPNPFTTKTTFTYQLGKTGFVELEIHSEIGAFVAKLVNMNQEEGSFSIDWNTADIAPGIYFYSLKVDGQLWVKKAVRIR